MLVLSLTRLSFPLVRFRHNRGGGNSNCDCGDMVVVVIAVIVMVMIKGRVLSYYHPAELVSRGCDGHALTSKR